MNDVAIIVGSGFAQANLVTTELVDIDTPYGKPSSPLLRLGIGSREILAIARHGLASTIAPHLVNYRANVWALRESGIRRCIGLNIVGGITAQMHPGTLAVPNQIIDYTWGRESSFGSLDDSDGRVVHVDVSEPFSSAICGALERGIVRCGLPSHRGVYAVTQGPRLETAAEIDKLDRDGCDFVGMTAMPEAALAREAGIEYAVLAGIVNYAAGRAPDAMPLHEQMMQTVDRVMRSSAEVLEFALDDLLSADL